MSSILLIHSNPVVAEEICRAFAVADNSSLVVSGAVDTLAKAREFLDRRVPDVLVIDLQVSDGPLAHWFERLRSGRRLRPRLIVIARTLHDPELLDALRRGADGYVLANTEPHDLIDVIEDVLSGRSMMDPEIARRLQMHFAQHEATGSAPLDDDDKQLLQWVSTGYGLDDIAQGLHTTPGRLGVQVRALYRKLQLDDPAASATAPRKSPPRRR